MKTKMSMCGTQKHLIIFTHSEDIVIGCQGWFLDGGPINYIQHHMTEWWRFGIWTIWLMSTLCKSAWNFWDICRYGHEDKILSIDSLHKENALTAGGQDYSIRLFKIDKETQSLYQAERYVVFWLVYSCYMACLFGYNLWCFVGFCYICVVFIDYFN